MSALAEKCNEGTLTTEEQREYEIYVYAGNLIAILKAKARLYLKRHATSWVLQMNSDDRVELRARLLELGELD